MALPLEDPNNLPKHNSYKPASADQLKRLKFGEEGWELVGHLIKFASFRGSARLAASLYMNFDAYWPPNDTLRIIGCSHDADGLLAENINAAFDCAA